MRREEALALLQDAVNEEIIDSEQAHFLAVFAQTGNATEALKESHLSFIKFGNALAERGSFAILYDLISNLKKEDAKKHIEDLLQDDKTNKVQLLNFILSDKFQPENLSNVIKKYEKDDANDSLDNMEFKEA